MADRMTTRKDGIEIGLKMAAGAVIEAGHLVAVNAAGFAVPAADTAGLKVMGVAQERKDNTGGANGDKTILVMRQKAFLLANAGTNGIAQADVGGNAYVDDSVTLINATGATNDIVAGTVLGVEVDGAWIWI